MGDIGLKCPTYLFAKQYAEHSTPQTNVFFYELTYEGNDFGPSLDLGIFHGADLEFVFGLDLLNPNKTSEQNIEFTKQFLKLWTDFAKMGMN